MAGFVGSAVIVTLKQGAVIQGFVQAVDPTSASLTLQDGKVNFYAASRLLQQACYPSLNMN
jgi:hypothetical protein